MKNRATPVIQKKTYTKPKVTEVRLVAGEAVLALCKDPAGGLTQCYRKHDLTCGQASSHS